MSDTIKAPPTLPYHQRPFCDVVMEGGTTSGVIYPGFIHELAQSYRLRSVGGTSAGAIAAAGAAAMELGRVRAGDDQVRRDWIETRLRQLPDRLGVDRRGRTLLARLFEPAPGPRGDLFTILLAAIHPRRSKVLGTLRALITSPILGRAPWVAMLLAVVMVAMAAISEGAGGWPPLVILALGAFALIVAWPRADSGPSRSETMALGVIGAFPAAIVIWLDGGLGGGWSWSAVGVLVLVGLAVIGLAPLEAVARTAIAEIPRNHFGVSSGFRPAADGSAAARTDEAESLNAYLAGLLNDLAGQVAGRILTFGDLADARPEAPIRLELVTTCLTLERPYRLPAGFDDTDDADAGRFYFRREDLSDFLPADVVTAMTTKARGDSVRGSVGSLASRHIEPGMSEFVPLPGASDLPVIFAVRLSLSLPLLLSAIPLYRRIPSKIESGDERFLRCWFSDGGLSSNFPIHLFDSALPDSPTFAANLREFGHSFPGVRVPQMPTDWPERVTSQTPNVLLDSERSTRTADRLEISPLGYNEIDSIATEDEKGYGTNGNEGSLTRSPAGGIAAMGSFLKAILTTSRRWRDSIHGPLPGYRDGVVHIGQDANEGGTNLEMDPDTIAILAARGGAGGQRLARQFLGDQGVVWRQHRWTRARMGLAAVARGLTDLEERYAMADHSGQTMMEFLTAAPRGTRYPWPERPREWVPASPPGAEVDPDPWTASARVGRLLAVHGEWARDGAFLDEARPTPDLDVRIVPRS